jgi:hypothetical protein
MALRTKPRIDRVLPSAAKPSSGPQALDLAEVDPPVWRVLADGRAIGPFTLGQLQAFADAGRLVALTRISSGDGQPFTLAVDHPLLRARIEAAASARGAQRAAASNHVILALDGGPGRQARLRELLATRGKVAEPMPGVFILRSGVPIAELRRAIAEAEPGSPALLIFESNDARLGTIGLSLAQSDAIRQVWNAALDPPSD